MQRRTVIKLAAGATALAAIPLGLLLGPGRQPERLVQAVLAKRLGHRETLEPAGVAQFATEFVRERQHRQGFQHRLIQALEPVYRHTPLLEHSPLRDAVWWLEREIVDSYLMRSDYFRRGKVLPGTPVRYLGATLEGGACANPFAQRQA